MKQYHSLVDPTLLLATVLNSEVDARTDAASTEEILQASVIPLAQGRQLRAHQHLATPRSTQGTQEAWVVMRGVIKAELFDVDRTHRETIMLGSGDCMILYRGAHSFEVVESAVIYEIKNGPYLGREMDSEPI
jgi:hypothetical protein